MYFKDIESSLGHTPLIELQDLSPKKSVHILTKLEGQSTGGSGSVKDRVAYYMIKKAEDDGRLSKDNVLLEATSGNTGIALAWLGRKKGYRVTIIMPDSVSQERRDLIRLFGAELILTDGKKGVQGSIELVQKMAATDDRYLMTDQFSNPVNPLAHYETTGVEILNDFPYEKIDYLVAGIGTGGTITGVARRLEEKFPSVKVIGVEPPPDDSIQGLRCLEKYIPPVLDLSLITRRAFVTSSEAQMMTRRLLEAEGIFAGLSSGAAAFEAVRIANNIDEGNIIVILPDSGWKYLSLRLWE